MSSNTNNGLNTSPLYLNANNVTSNVNVNIGDTNSLTKYRISVPHLLMKNKKIPVYVGRSKDAKT